MYQLFTIFLTVFVAELGDKTQLATLLFATDGRTSRLGVFLASSAALVASSGLAVILGGQAERHLGAVPLKAIAGTGFVLIGVWMIWDQVRG